MPEPTILVTGSTGFLGSHLMKALGGSAVNLIGVSSAEADLTNAAACDALFAETRPAYVINLAAKSGGIQSNRTQPADYFRENILILTNVYASACKVGVVNMITPMGGCSYPATARSPISEDQMWLGYPQIESAGYSLAKKMALVLADAYRTQEGLQSAVVVPGNMYGEFDNFNLEHSHVLPAMIRKFCLATDDVVTFWGSGAPKRDFVYAGDVAEIISKLIFDDNFTGPINISSGTETSIRELAGKVAAASGFEGQILWDDSYPDGQMVKIFDTSLMREHGLACNTDLDYGIDKTIRWFKESYPTGVRL